METTFTWSIAPRLEAVSLVRRQVRKALADWGRPDAIDDLTLVVSELVTNALIHGEPPVTLTLSLEPGAIRGTVADLGPDLPRLLDTRDTAEHGRGLLMVADLTRTLAWKRAAEGGKRVTFTYAAPDSP